MMQAIIFRKRSDFVMIDLREKNADGARNEWKRGIVTNKGKNKATVGIQGIESGIAVDYYFEKIGEKWMLIRMDDSST